MFVWFGFQSMPAEIECDQARHREPNREGNYLGQLCVIDGGFPAGHPQTAVNIDRSERAGFIGQKWLFAARISGFNEAGLRCGICLVDRVEEENARLSGSPSCFHEPVKDHLNRELSDRFAGSGIHQAVGPTLPDSTHETVSESNREIEVRHFMRLLLQGNEIQNVGVVDPQDAHIGTPSRATLLNDVSGQVEQAHKGDRA